MKKRAVSLFLSLLLLLTTVPSALGAESLSNFSKTRTYSESFADVPPDSWYAEYVSLAYEYSIIDGMDDSAFHPDGKITIAETIKLAVCLHRIYSIGSAWFPEGEPWYKPYVDYARQKGIIADEYKNYDAAATRADFAAILANALPDEALTTINKLSDGAVPDVTEGYSYGAAVYKLYRAGILAGCDDEGRFYPSNTIRRSEAAAIVVRMISAELRLKLSLKGAPTPEQLYSICSPAVLFVEVFDDDGDLVKTGSGFFISEAGLAITNYHVVAGAATARVTTPDGESYEVAGICDYNRKQDIALLQIEGDGFPYLELGDSSLLVTGATVYTIGSPLGLQNSFSKGIIAGPSRFFNDVEYIQTDAVISSGSSGGALLDASGRVVGITSAAVDGGQSLNLAVPIRLLSELNRDVSVPLGSIRASVKYYNNHKPVPDFGAFAGAVKPYSEVYRGNTATFSYRVTDLPEGTDEMIDGYKDILEQNLFSLFGYFIIDGYDFTAYSHGKSGKVVMIGINKVSGKECITIEIM